jgi:hypothetical protein
VSAPEYDFALVNTAVVNVKPYLSEPCGTRTLAGVEYPAQKQGLEDGVHISGLEAAPYRFELLLDMRTVPPPIFRRRHIRHRGSA